MAKTKSLNSSNTVYVTTFYGGPDKGRSYTMTANVNGARTQKTFTEAELFIMLGRDGVCMMDNGVRPCFDG